MNVNEAVSLAHRLESIIRRSSTFNKGREDILEEIEFMAQDLRDYADRLDSDIYKEFSKESV